MPETERQTCEQSAAPINPNAEFYPNSVANTDPDPDPCLQVRMLADPQAELAKALGVDFDASGMLGNVRSKRCALSSRHRKLVGYDVDTSSLVVRHMMAGRARI